MVIVPRVGIRVKKSEKWRRESETEDHFKAGWIELVSAKRHWPAVMTWPSPKSWCRRSERRLHEEWLGPSHRPQGQGRRRRWRRASRRRSRPSILTRRCTASRCKSPCLRWGPDRTALLSYVGHCGLVDFLVRLRKSGIQRSEYQSTAARRWQVRLVRLYGSLSDAMPATGGRPLGATQLCLQRSTLLWRLLGANYQLAGATTGHFRKRGPATTTQSSKTITHCSPTTSIYRKLC